MSIFLEPVNPKQYWSGKNIFFLHNWRCAGTSVTSLLASNFGKHYIKVGHPFSANGHPIWYKSNPTQITTLEQIRDKFQPGYIVGGHLFTGIESLIGGSWDLWMNARNPVERVSSGLLRFHSKSLARLDKDNELMQRTNALSTQEDVIKLLNGPLKREVNGLSKRLAGMAIANDISINQESNLEKIMFLEKDFSDEYLYKVAVQQLSRLKILILPNAFQASILCLEEAYQLPPVINPFSNLKHNPVNLGKPSMIQKDLIKASEPILTKLMKSDIALWQKLRKAFVEQLDRYKISREDILVRQLIHREALLDPRWLKEEDVNEELVLKGFAGRIAQRAVEAKQLGPRLISTVGRWPRLKAGAAQEISARAMHAWKRHSNDA